MCQIIEEWGLIEEEFVCDLEAFTITEEDEKNIEALIEPPWQEGESRMRLM